MRQLAEILTDVEAGRFPPPDGSVEVARQPSPRDVVVVAFTAYTVVAADVDPHWVRSILPIGDLCAPLNPPFLSELAARTGREVNNVDQVLLSAAADGEPDLALRERRDGAGGVPHPRVRRALRHRDDVRVFEADGGVLTVGRGVAGRWEVAFEVDPEHRGRGLGRRLAAAARHVVPAGSHVWGQVAPGNAASVRALLEAGFAPVGAEALLVARH